MSQLSGVKHTYTHTHRVERALHGQWCSQQKKYLLHPPNTTFLVSVNESQLFRYDNPVSMVVVELGFVCNVLNWISVVSMATRYDIAR